MSKKITITIIVAALMFVIAGWLFLFGVPQIQYGNCVVSGYEYCAEQLYADGGFFVNPKVYMTLLDDNGPIGSSSYAIGNLYYQAGYSGDKFYYFNNINGPSSWADISWDANGCNGLYPGTTQKTKLASVGQEYNGRFGIVAWDKDIKADGSYAYSWAGYGWIGSNFLNRKVVECLHSYDCDSGEICSQPGDWKTWKCVVSECEQGQSKCEGTDYFICYSSDSAWVWNNYGPIVGQCGVSAGMSEEEIQAYLDTIAQLELTLGEKIALVQDLVDNVDAQVLYINALSDNIDEKAAIITALELNLADQTLLIQQLSDKRDEQAEIISNLGLTIQEQANIISNMQLTAVEQAEIITNLGLNLEGQKEIISNLNLQIEEQAALINQLTTNLADKVYLVSQLQIENEEQAALIALMELSFGDQAGIINALNLEISDDAEIIANLGLSLDEQINLVNMLELSNIEKQQLIDSLQSTIEEQAQQIIAMGLSLQEQAEYIISLNLNNADMAALISQLGLSLEEQATLINNLKLTLADDAEIINNLNLKLDEELLLIENLKITIAEQQKLLDEMGEQQDQPPIIDYGKYLLIGIGLVIAFILIIIFLVNRIKKYKKIRK